MTAWTDLVKKIYGENKHKKGYKLGHAMKAGKKIYKTMKAAVKKSGKTAKKRGGGMHEPTMEPTNNGGMLQPNAEPINNGGMPEPTMEPKMNGINPMPMMGGKKKSRRRH